MKDSAATNLRWLLLIHQIPPKPDYFRVKVRRRLQRIGAAALKNSVYVLPVREETAEDFRWLLREIVSEGGEATLCEATLVEGLKPRELIALFCADRDVDYAELVVSAQRLIPSEDAEALSSVEAEAEVGKLQRQFEEIVSIDYFEAPGRRAAERA